MSLKSLLHIHDIKAEKERNVLAVLSRAESLLDRMDSAPDGFVDNHDLGVLHQELQETIKQLKKELNQ